MCGWTFDGRPVPSPQDAEELPVPSHEDTDGPPVSSWEDTDGPPLASGAGTGALTWLWGEGMCGWTSDGRSVPSPQGTEELPVSSHKDTDGLPVSSWEDTGGPPLASGAGTGALTWLRWGHGWRNFNIKQYMDASLMWLQFFEYTGVSQLTRYCSSKCGVHQDIVIQIIKDSIGTKVIKNGKEMTCCQSHLHRTSQEIMFTIQAHFLWYNNVRFLLIACNFPCDPKVDNNKIRHREIHSMWC